jgi:hypothetical protein
VLPLACSANADAASAAASPPDRAEDDCAEGNRENDALLVPLRALGVVLREGCAVRLLLVGFRGKGVQRKTLRRRSLRDLSCSYLFGGGGGVGLSNRSKRSICESLESAKMS